MSLNNIIFEKVGDINSIYPYLCVYHRKDELNPFMEIAVNEEKQLQYTIYPNANNIVLTAEDWECIESKAKEFLPKAIADEDAI